MDSSFPAVFELLKEYGVMTTKEKLVKFAIIPLEERPNMLVYVSDKPCDIRVLCVEGEGIQVIL